MLFRSLVAKRKAQPAAAPTPAATLQTASAEGLRPAQGTITRGR